MKHFIVTKGEKKYLKETSSSDCQTVKLHIHTKCCC